MKKKQKNIYNLDDFRNESGKWVLSYTETTDIDKTRFVTRAGTLWSCITSRCKRGGKYQENKQTYEGCSNNFIDFQAFAEWCQEEFGYLNKNPNDSYWGLDKDIIKDGNKTYSPETCIFVPSKINSLFVTSAKSRVSLPLGVSSYGTNGKFRATCGIKHLGVFDTPIEAHHAWQKEKINNILQETLDTSLGSKLILALEAKAERISLQLGLGLITEA